MFEKNRDFYPTPQSIIDKMLCGLNFRKIKSILEPSAGDGRILDVLREKDIASGKASGDCTFDMECIESDPGLRQVLKSKDYRVVSDDFLTFSTLKEYDLIIMNPPFSEGCRHLLRAMEMAEKSGGTVVCLLNAESIKNPYSNERLDLKQRLEAGNAQIELIQDAFTEAERRTAVEIALIKIQFSEARRRSLILDSLKVAQQESEPEESDPAGLVSNDFFKAIVNQYELEIQAGAELIKEYNAMKPFILSALKKDETTGQIAQTGGCILSLKICGGNSGRGLSVNEYIREVHGKYWKALFENRRFTGNLTKNLQYDFYNGIRTEDRDAG